MTKNDVMLVQEIRKQGKSFFFILTKIDQEYQALKRKKSFNEANMLRDIRTHCLKNLNYEGYNAISGEDIFLISNHHPRKWDFDRLMRVIAKISAREPHLVSQCPNQLIKRNSKEKS